MRNARFRGVAADEQLGNLEYLIDDGVTSEYRALVGECGNYANLIADDCESMAAARFGISGLTTAWRRFDFLRPPIRGASHPGRRMAQGDSREGWLAVVEGVGVRR